MAQVNGAAEITRIVEKEGESEEVRDQSHACMITEKSGGGKQNTEHPPEIVSQTVFKTRLNRVRLF